RHGPAGSGPAPHGKAWNQARIGNGAGFFYGEGMTDKSHRITIELPALSSGDAPIIEIPEAQHPRVLQAIFAEHWMITPEGLRTILEVAAFGQGDSYRPQANLIDAFSIEPRAEPFIRNGAGVISLSGPIFPRGNMLTR